MKVELLRETNDALKLLTDAASICYGREEAKNPRRLAEKLLNLKHLSVFEHIYFTWKIEGVSRALLAQLTRHRLSSPTVRSQRYCDEAIQEIIIPSRIKEDKTALYLVEKLIGDIRETYKALRTRGIPKEDARFILPNGTATELMFSCNLRELLHIYKLRTSPGAQEEIRQLAYKMVECIDDELKFIFEYGVTNNENYL